VAVLSVDLAYRLWSDLGIVVLDRVRPPQSPKLLEPGSGQPLKPLFTGPDEPQPTQFPIACEIIPSIALGLDSDLAPGPVDAAHAQEIDDEGEAGVYGYTSIDYDPNTNVVTAYSETNVYGEALYFYQAEVQLNSNGHYMNEVSPNPTDSSVSATISYQGTAGNTYQAVGQHEVELTSKYLAAADYEYYDEDDAFGFIEWQYYGIDVPWQFPFTALDSDNVPEVGVVNLGQTYETVQTSIPASCGISDERTAMIQEYVMYDTPYFPQCAEFTNALVDQYFTFAQLNTGDYTWAILRNYFISKLDALEGLDPGFNVNSAYRDPSKEYAVAIAAGGTYVPGSRHQYGDAVDVATTSSTWQTYQTDGHQLGACVEPPSVQGGLYAHAHLDWRDLATVGPTYTGCPTGW
jgi:hypothetical protein